MVRRLFFIVLILAWLASNLVLGAEWQFQPLGDLGGRNDDGKKSSQAFAVSGDGRFIVGDSLATAGLGITTGTEALLASPGSSPTALGLLKDATNSAAKSVSSGPVVVGVVEMPQGERRAFRWEKKSGMTPLKILPGHDESTAYDISDDGRVIVGKSGTFGEELAVQWRDEQLIKLGDLPGGYEDSAAFAVSADGRVIVGQSSGERGPEAFIWSSSDSTMKGLGSLGGEPFSSRAIAVSADGKTLVGSSTSPRGQEAFRWTEATGMQPLGDLPGGSFLSRAMGVSADGKAIVGTASNAGGWEAILWTPDQKMQAIRKLLAQEGLAKDWRLTEACGISNDGTTIVGFGTNPAGETAGWVITRR